MAKKWFAIGVLAVFAVLPAAAGYVLMWYDQEGSRIVLPRGVPGKYSSSLGNGDTITLNSDGTYRRVYTPAKGPTVTNCGAWELSNAYSSAAEVTLRPAHRAANSGAYGPTQPGGNADLTLRVMKDHDGSCLVAHRIGVYCKVDQPITASKP